MDGFDVLGKVSSYSSIKLYINSKLGMGFTHKNRNHSTTKVCEPHIELCFIIEITSNLDQKNRCAGPFFLPSQKASYSKALLYLKAE